MPYVDHTEKLACQKRYRDKNTDRLNADARARWKYRHSTPEKHEAYKQIKRAWYERTKEKRRAYQLDWKKKNWRSVLATRLKVNFKLSIAEFDKMFESQDGRCLICNCVFTKQNPPHVDHCHTTGRFRALLCKLCNVAEGSLRTSENARRMYEFMLSNELLSQSTN